MKDIRLKAAIDGSNLKLARKCLALIRDIAARGALSENPDNVGYALQELSQVLIERAGTEEIQFEPISAHWIAHLAALCEELAFVDAGSQDLSHMEGKRYRGQWN